MKVSICPYCEANLYGELFDDLEIDDEETECDKCNESILVTYDGDNINVYKLG